MKYLKYFESTSHIGETITFIAKHKERKFGTGFVVAKKDINDKFVGNIPCEKGTEITGVVVDFKSIPGLDSYYHLKLPDNTFANCYLDFFDVKS